MTATLLALIAIRSAATIAQASGDLKTANMLRLVADTVEAGAATDEHLRLVAEKLRSRDLTEADWEDVLSRIERDRAKLQGMAPPSTHE